MPTTIGPFDNVPVPGDPIRSAWAQELTQYAVDIAGAPVAYTPTLTGMAIGSGGAAGNTAEYMLVGDPAGSGPGSGLIFIRGAVFFGTTGATFPTSPTVSLPAGFTWATSSRGIGLLEIEDAATAFFVGWCYSSLPNTIQFQRQAVSGSNIVHAQITPTAPMTWAPGDGFRWSVLGAAVGHT